MTVNYNSIRFGPIYAKDEREVRHIFEFFNDKIRKYEFKNQEIRVGKVFAPTSAAVQAKWALPSDVVQYIEKSLTKKEINKKMVGKKRPSYPKRSEIIKLPKQSEPIFSSTTPANAPTNPPANPPANPPTQGTGVREGVMARAMARAKARKLTQASALVPPKGQIFSKGLFGVPKFSQKRNERIRRSSKNEFVRSFFGRIRGYQKSFRNYLTFSVLP